jgi:cytoskeletal protein RodZ
VRRRLFVALLAVGLLLVAGFTAAALASGGSPFGLLEDQPKTAADTTTGRNTLKQTTTDETTSESTTDESSKDESADDEKPNEKTTTDASETSSDVEHKVTICHHTGSKKHPFHPITVDEHAVPAHTGHGDTVGPCPAATASTAPPAKVGKPKHRSGKARGGDRSAGSEQGGRNGNGRSHRPGKHTGGPSK